MTGFESRAHSNDIAMNSTHSTLLIGLFCLATGLACDPGSESLGDEPTAGSESEGGSGSDAPTTSSGSEGSSGSDAPTTGSGSEDSSGSELVPSAESEVLGVIEGASIDDLEVRSDGSVIVAGRIGDLGMFGDSTVYENLWVAAFAEQGGLLWERTFPFPENELGEPDERYFSGLSTTPDGSVFATLIDFSDTPVSENEVSKYSADGTLQWTTILPYKPRSVAGTGNGGAIVVGLEPAEDNPSAVYGWAARIDSLGAIVATRTWTNPDGSGTLFDSVTASDEHGFLIGGSWGTSTEGSRADAWLLWVDDDLQTLAEIRLPASGGTDRVSTLRVDADGNGLAIVHFDAPTLVTVSPEAAILSTVVIDPDLVLPSPYSATGYLGTEPTNCADGDDPAEPCADAAFVAIEDEERQWEHTIQGCAAGPRQSLDAQTAIVALYCDLQTDDGVTTSTSVELHRIQAP